MIAVVTAAVTMVEDNPTIPGNVKPRSPFAATA